MYKGAQCVMKHRYLMSVTKPYVLSRSKSGRMRGGQLANTDSRTHLDFNTSTLFYSCPKAAVCRLTPRSRGILAVKHLLRSR